MKNLGAGTFATPQSEVHVGTEVVTGNTVYTWKFGDTYVMDHYTYDTDPIPLSHQQLIEANYRISPMGQTVGLVWGISTDGFKIPVRISMRYVLIRAGLCRLILLLQVRLATSYTDRKNQWKLERLSSGSAPTGLSDVPAGDVSTDQVDRGPADIPSNASQTHVPSPDNSELNHPQVIYDDFSQSLRAYYG